MTRRSGAMQFPKRGDYVTRTVMIAVVGAASLSGCSGARVPANVAEGCYRFDDEAPFLRVVGSRGTFVNSSGLNSFDIGAWNPDDRELEVRPAFVLHDGNVSSPAGPTRMAIAVTSRSSGTVRYEQVEGRTILSIPVEAHGWETVHLGRPC